MYSCHIDPAEVKQEIKEELKPLFEKAEKEGLWFYTNYQSLWFTPEQLREKQKEGRFVWGKENWQLRNPRERLKEIKKKNQELEQKIERFEQRLTNNHQ
jgi:hypothetical protein